jgi:glycine hydroxymethyltransferase
MLLDKDARSALRTKKKHTYTPLQGHTQDTTRAETYHRNTWQALQVNDNEVYSLLNKEYQRQQDTLQLIAAENRCSQAVLAALGSTIQNKTTEGFVGARYHGGCQVVDTIESLAIERSKQAFAAQYANVQPHSGTTANHIVFTALLQRDDRILSLGLDQGGHVSHGARVSLTGKFFQNDVYTVHPQTLQLDYDMIRQRALETQPKMIVCGASAYSRIIDFERFRRIADEIGAYLLADVSHIAGLILAGVHPSPIDAAHITTTSTYKPGGPRGGLILMGNDFDLPVSIGSTTRPLWQQIDKTTFPGVQGTPYLNHIAAKAVFFKETQMPEYKTRQFRIIENARALADCLMELGFPVVTGGTDNHMILVNVADFREGLTGVIAQRCLEDCGIIVNMNRLPYDPRSQRVTSGMRLGTPVVTRNGMQPSHMRLIGPLLHDVLTHVDIQGDMQYQLDDTLKANISATVTELCRRFPIDRPYNLV